MSAVTGIEWTATVAPDGTVKPGATWNPVTGCRKVSPGCAHCYAEGVAKRFWATQYRPVLADGTGRSIDTVSTSHHDDLLANGLARPRQFTDVQCHPERLREPLSWRTPRTVFVNSMSDLFEESVPDEFIDQVFAVMARCPHLTFIVLTKRAERMHRYMTLWPDGAGRVHHVRSAVMRSIVGGRDWRDWSSTSPECVVSLALTAVWPLPNVRLGVSVENQHFADSRIQVLLETPAACRLVSLEPLLGFVNLTWVAQSDDERDGAFDALRGGDWIVKDSSVSLASSHVPMKQRTYVGVTRPRLDWVIVGGESGHDARPCDVRWVRAVVQHCQMAGVPVFVKQLGSHVRDRNDAGFLGEDERSWPDVIDQEDRIEHDLDGTRDGYQGAPVRIHLKSQKGGDPSEWPEDLRVREFPAAVAAPERRG